MKRLCILFCLYSTFYPLLPHRNPSPVAILCLHDIGGKGIYALKVKEFNKLMRHLSQQPDLRVVSFREWVRTPHVPNKRTIILTFDDGYPSLKRRVVPTLTKYNFGATFFIYLDRYKSESPFFSFLKKLPPQFEIASHSLTHDNLQSKHVSQRQLYQELLFSKIKLEYLTGRPVQTFAWPYGSYNPKLLEAARLAGYQYQVTTDSKLEVFSEDKDVYARFTLNKGRALRQFREIFESVLNSDTSASPSGD